MNRSEKADVTVAVTTFNRPDDLTQCLASLSRQTIKDFDVLIVNGGALEPVEAAVKNFRLNIKVITQSKKGLVEARNACWKEAQGRIVCIIDDDLVVAETWLEEILKTFDQDDSIGGVTGPTLIDPGRSSRRDAFSMIDKFEKGNWFWRAIGTFYLNFVLEGRIRDVGRILKCGTFSLGSNFPGCLKESGLIEVDYLEACHMCYRKDVVAWAGGFDDRYTGTGEWSEPDLACKIRKLGFKLVFNPRAVTEHRISQQGVFKARTYAFERSVNFINFYFRNVKPNTVDKFLRFYAYLFFMNGYWLYKGFESRNMSWLSGLPGTFVGLGKNWLHICQD
jgi:GT2 family glycosyltransferase